MRRFLRTWTVGFVTALGLLSGAMAGIGLGPIGQPEERLPRAPQRLLPPGAAPGARIAALPAPGEGEFLVGAGKVSLAPRPPEGETWKTEGCQTFDPTDPSSPPDPGWDYELAQTPWPQDPDCIYLGGYGIGPVRPATGVSDLGVWAKAIAVSDGEDTVILGKIDGVGYFYRLDAGQCADCGIADIQAALSAEFAGQGITIPPRNIMFASSHSHGSADYLGGWGGVADWYLKQTAEAMKEAARQAVRNMKPAVIDAGDEVVRAFNAERRDFYRSASDNQLVWLKASDAETGAVIATIVNYAAHPTVLGSDNLLLHPDWPGGTEARLEQAYPGSVGVVLMSGLGNQSDNHPNLPDASPEAIGAALGEVALADMDDGTRITGDVAANVEEFDQPVTNIPLGALGAVGFFDRAFSQLPVAGSWQENQARPCASASALSVRTTMGGYRIGDLALMFGPGELFSNITIAVKDELDAARQVMVVSLANDELGYLIQSFEFDVAAQQALGFVGGIVEYEEAFSLDRCFGDRVVEGLIAHGHALGF